jgi:hypothetical protein
LSFRKAEALGNRTGSPASRQTPQTRSDRCALRQ